MKKTETQQHYADVRTLRGRGVDATPEELAELTGGNAADFRGVLVAQDSPALRELSRGRERRLMSMASMDDSGEGVIGFALIVRDIRRLVRRFRRS